MHEERRAGQSRVALAWIEGRDALVDVGRWMGARANGDDAYISHGEIQWSLSPDGTCWAEDAVERFAEDVAHIAEENGARRVAEARGSDGKRLGAALVDWIGDAPTPHAILEDVIVDPHARRSGVGAALVAFVEAEARARGLGWVFLESGLRNDRAHAFFTRAGYGPVSKVFAKKL